MDVQNSFDNAMDTDDAASSASKKKWRGDESEEGEVTDDDTAVIPAKPPQKSTAPVAPVLGLVSQEMESDLFENRAGGYITGVDVFGKDEQARLVERAKRFGLDSSQINLLSEKELKKLYRSVGVSTGVDGGKEFRFDSLRMHGTEAMSTKDIFEYFRDYAPSSIEWVNDESCNVIWLDNMSAIRALIGLSKPIKNLKKVQNSDSKKISSLEKKNKLKFLDHKIKGEEEDDSDVIMIEDGDGRNETVITTAAYDEIEKDLDADPEAVDALDLDFVIPPGCWRKGDTHPHSDGILLRFCRQEERKALNSENARRLPQPVFGMVGLVSKSRKKRIKEGLIIRPKQFPDDMGDERDFVLSSDDENSRNPWGTLAKSWGHIDRARQPRPPPPAIEDTFGDRLMHGPLLPPPPPMLLDRHLPREMPLPPRSILNRVGIKLHSDQRTSQGRFTRSRSRSESPEKRVPVHVQRGLHSRLQGKRQRLEDNSDDSAFSGSDSDDENWTRKSKIPRMRMYADEEEVKVKQRTMLKARRRMSPQRQLSKVNDLRSRLGRDSGRHSERSSERHSERSGVEFRTGPTAKHSARHSADRDVPRNSERRGRERSHRNFSATAMYSDEGISHRPRSSTHHKVMSVASSVWTRLSQENAIKIKEESTSELETTSSNSEDTESRHSDSELEEENITVTRTISSGVMDDGDLDDEDEVYERKRAAAASKLGIDLRSKLNKKKGVQSTGSSANTMLKSPLRIEIDNDEYYRLIDGDQE